MTADVTAVEDRLASFIAVVRKTSGPVLILGHNYPDPDCMAAGLGMQALLRQRCDREASLAFGGGLGRPENRAMVGVLGIEFLDPDSIVASDWAGVVLVDTQPGAGNNTLPDGLPVIAVLDNHVAPGLREGACEIAFSDVRSDLSAICTLVYQYLNAAAVPIDERLATALLVGIRTDTEDLERDETEDDVAAFVRLYRLANRRQMQQIMRPPLGEAYFGLMRRGLEVARRRGEAVISNLGTVPAPDMLSEVAEFFARLKGVEYSLAVGIYEGDVFLSLRTRRPRTSVFEIMAAIVGPNGRAGGHRRAAGGRISVRDGEPEAAAASFCTAFVEAIGEAENGPRPVCLHEGEAPSEEAVR